MDGQGIHRWVLAAFPLGNLTPTHHLLLTDLAGVVHPPEGQLSLDPNSFNSVSRKKVPTPDYDLICNTFSSDDAGCWEHRSTSACVL